MGEEPLFTPLEPPPGGLTRLRARLAKTERRRIERSRRLAGIAAGAAVLLAFGGWQLRASGRDEKLEETFGPELLEKAGVRPASGSTVQPLGDTAVQLASSGEVPFYRVGVLSGGGDRD